MASPTRVHDNATIGVLERGVVLANGKGGVGKTSTVANVAGLCALSGLRVLTVDLDPQGNLSRDIGYERDKGQQLFMALVGGGELPIIRDAGGRDGLDCVPGGLAMSDLVGVLFSRASNGGSSLAQMLWDALSPVANDYDLILFDTPPGDATINEGVLGVARAVVIPTRSDEASIDGLEVVARRFVVARETNPHLRLAGVLLFGIGSRSSRLDGEVRRIVSEALDDVAPIFTTRIRYLESAAADQRRTGLMIHELEGAASEAQAERLAALRSGNAPGAGDVFTRAPQGLADDYEAFAHELLDRLRELEEEEN